VSVTDNQDASIHHNANLSASTSPSPSPSPLASASATFTENKDQGSTQRSQLICDSTDVKYPAALYNPSADQLFTISDKLKRIIESSDVVKGVYEGGMKVWECSLDMVQYLKHHYHSTEMEKSSRSSSLPSLVGLRVAELGAGHALPGIYCLQQGSQFVALQDLNEDVLSMITVPKVLERIGAISNSLIANFEFGAQIPKNVQFFSGDWNSNRLPDIMLDALTNFLSLHNDQSQSSSEQQGFDLILTCDTIYSSSSIPPLVQLIKKLLNRSYQLDNNKEEQHSTGRKKSICLLAEKRFYFGVGGSTAELLDHIAKFHTDMKCSIVDVIEDKQSNIREIIQLEFR
jgi:hypothetical protein